MEMFQKKCPECGGPQKYECKKTFLKSFREGWKCRRCAVSKSHAESPRSFFWSGDYKQKMSESLKQARVAGNYGEEFKTKCRENKLKQLMSQGTQRTFNINACRFMDAFSFREGINLQHGLNGGEIQFIGYSLDGYDKKKNVVFEYDEPKHHAPSMVKKDKERERRLIEFLNPRAFWRYDERTSVLRDVISGKEIK